uniref:Tc3 transposase DNA binding domain-containing protein n=1 Tax=Strigamia maritima TaxID=126957 RepID=T1J7B6_STRMM
MPRGTNLTDYEKGQIDTLKTAGNSARAISKAIGRSPGVIINYIILGKKYGQKKDQEGLKNCLIDRKEEL